MVFCKIQCFCVQLLPLIGIDTQEAGEVDG